MKVERLNYTVSKFISEKLPVEINYCFTRSHLSGNC